MFFLEETFFLIDMDSDTFWSFFYYNKSTFATEFYRHKYLIKKTVKWVQFVFFHIYIFFYVCIIGFWFYFILLKLWKNFFKSWIKYLLNLWKKKKLIYINFIILIYKIYEIKNFFKQYKKKIYIFFNFLKKLKKRKKKKKKFNFLKKRLNSFLTNVSK